MLFTMANYHITPTRNAVGYAEFTMYFSDCIVSLLKNQAFLVTSIRYVLHARPQHGKQECWWTSYT